MAKLRKCISASTAKKCGNESFPILSITMKDGIVLQSDKFKKRIASADTSTYICVPYGKLVQGIHIDEGNFGVQDIVPMGIVSPAYKLWDINEDVVLPKYIEMVLRSPKCIEYYKAKLTGTVNRRGRMSATDFLDMDIPLPNKEKQYQIVENMNKLNQLITMRKEQLAKLDQLVKSRFIELFGDPIANPKKWEADDMKTICTKITDGEHGSVVRVESGNVFLNAKHIKKDGTIDWKTVTYTTSEVHRKIYARCNPEPGDILLTTTGTIGNVAIVPNVAPFSMDRGITLLKLDRGKVNSNFVAALLNFECIQNIMNANVHASAIGHLFLNQVMRIPVVIPPMELQNQFAAFVEQTDKSKLAIQQSLDKLELLKKSLMQEYFG